MSSGPHFSFYLSELMEEKGLDAEALSRQLGYRVYVPVGAWCRGDGLPSADQLPRLARILQTDPISLSVIWLISMCPELGAVLRSEVLEPRGIACPLPASAPMSLEGE
jgi:hypothetical protein